MAKGDFPGYGFGQDRLILVAGLVVFVLLSSMRILIGRLYTEAEVVRFLESIEDPALFFASGLSASATTILALMLTLLSFTQRLENDFNREFFQRVSRIGLYSVFVLCGSIVLIVLLIFPLGEFTELPADWYSKLYTGVVLMVAALAALIFVTVILLFGTIRRLIEIMAPS